MKQIHCFAILVIVLCATRTTCLHAQQPFPFDPQNPPSVIPGVGGNWHKLPGSITTDYSNTLSPAVPVRWGTYEALNPWAKFLWGHAQATANYGGAWWATQYVRNVNSPPTLVYSAVYQNYPYFVVNAETPNIGVLYCITTKQLVWRATETVETMPGYFETIQFGSDITCYVDCPVSMTQSYQFIPD